MGYNLLIHGYIGAKTHLQISWDIQVRRKNPCRLCACLFPYWCCTIVLWFMWSVRLTLHQLSSSKLSGAVETSNTSSFSISTCRMDHHVDLQDLDLPGWHWTLSGDDHIVVTLQKRTGQDLCRRGMTAKATSRCNRTRAERRRLLEAGGKPPSKHSCNTTPSDHRSQDMACSLFRKTSGAADIGAQAQSTEPSRIHHCSPHASWEPPENNSCPCWPCSRYCRWLCVFEPPLC